MRVAVVYSRGLSGLEAPLVRVEAALAQQQHEVVMREPRCADLAEVRGQHGARRALEIAAAGRHSLLCL